MEITSGAKRFVATACVALGVFMAVALATTSALDWPFDPAKSIRQVSNYSGPLGSFLSWIAIVLFGRLFAWLVPLWFFLLGVATLTGGIRQTAGWISRTLLVVVLLNAVFSLLPYTVGIPALQGRVGGGIATALSAALGEIGSSIVLIAVLLVLILNEIGRVSAWRPAAGRAASRGSGGRRFAPGFAGAATRGLRGVANATAGIASLLSRATLALARVLARAVRALGALLRRRPASEEREVRASASAGSRAGAAETVDEFDTKAWKRPTAEDLPPVEITSAFTQKRESRTPPQRPSKSKAVAGAPGTDESKRKSLEKAALPPLTMLEQGADTGGSYSHEKLKEWSEILVEKLKDYGVEGRVTAVHHGPVVTTFEFSPSPGVRVKEIVNRADDLALAMRARSLRMIAPIPGRAAVGIEIPNPESRIVYLYDILNEISEKQRLGGVMIGLAVDVVGKPFLINLCDAPHLLIAGTTGSGKSVCLNAIIASILFQYRPNDVQILLVDPKMIEMSMYDGIPHLLHPVITDPKEAAKVLEYLTVEMRRRNALFRRHGVKNIESYNTKVGLGKLTGVDEKPERLPYILLIVDELGDLALAKGVDIETLLARLAQMARAAGIHMVLATQRPSVDVIVGKTKANFPTRIAFRVATKVDSRTILDTVGAEKLLGKGDMLFTDAYNPVPLRLHGAWVSEQNVEDLITYWKSYQYEESSLELETAGSGAAEVDGDLDPLFGDAKGVVIQYKQGSTSLLQRKLHVGYARAARLLDQLEQCGIVGPPDGSKPREVYVDQAEEALE